MTNPISASDVFDMICTDEYQRRKCVDAGALTHAVEIIRTGDTAVIKAKRKLPTVGFPKLLRKLVPSGVTSTETISWGPPDKSGARTAELDVHFHGAPASMRGEISIVPVDPMLTQVIVDAEFTAHVPLIGSRVEGFAAPIIVGVIDSEERTAQAWVAARL
ncbi:MAG TPA: DUF2505 domain-containing protein [Jatrophihabitantaceae bacterium]|nr:DUF2505 domain-containing protein [Jatrophihabitantaceae bacterium]